MARSSGTPAPDHIAPTGRFMAAIWLRPEGGEIEFGGERDITIGSGEAAQPSHVEHGQMRLQGSGQPRPALKQEIPCRSCSASSAKRSLGGSR